MVRIAAPNASTIYKSAPQRSLVKTNGLSTLTAYAVKTEVKMSDRPVNGDHPDYNPSPDNPEKDGRKPKDDPGSAPESGDKDPE